MHKRILWLCNTTPSYILRKENLLSSNFGGWLDLMCEKLVDDQNIDFCVVSPGKYNSYKISDEYTYCTFSNLNISNFFKKVLETFSPDIIHIWGTEYKHTMIMTEVAKQINIINRCVISIQGLTSVIGKYHYLEGIPNEWIHKYTLRDFIKFDNLYRQKNKFLIKGDFEKQALLNVKNVIGRTDWDKAVVSEINPSLNYYFCNESLRSSFYTKKWDKNNIEPYSIFVSQCSYPVKGFHYMLEAFPEILKHYPDAHLYTTGIDLIHLNINNKIKLTTYQKYLIHLINKYSLNEKITFLGNLSAEEMCEQYLKTNVFVSPSTIENSSNSIGEAMILGCPVISSDVGGIKNLLLHEKEGFIYQSTAPYMISYYVKKLFSDKKIAEYISINSRKHAIETHDSENNLKQLIRIYDELLKKQEDF